MVFGFDSGRSNVEYLVPARSHGYNSPNELYQPVDGTVTVYLATDCSVLYQEHLRWYLLDVQIPAVGEPVLVSTPSIEFRGEPVIAETPRCSR